MIHLVLDAISPQVCAHIAVVAIFREPSAYLLAHLMDFEHMELEIPRAVALAI